MFEFEYIQVTLYIERGSEHNVVYCIPHMWSLFAKILLKKGDFGRPVVDTWSLILIEVIKGALK